MRASGGSLMFNAATQHVFEVGGTNKGTISGSGGTGVFSDRDMKEDISNIDIGLTEVLQLQPRKFKYKLGNLSDEKIAEIRDAPVVELLDEDNEELSDAEKLSSLENQIRTLKPSYQQAKTDGDEAMLSELKPQLESLLKERKQLMASTCNGSVQHALANNGWRCASSII